MAYATVPSPPVVVKVWLNGVPTVAVRASGAAWVDGSVNARSLPSPGAAAGVALSEAFAAGLALGVGLALALGVGLALTVGLALGVGAGVSVVGLALGVAVAVVVLVGVVGSVGVAAVADAPTPMTEPMAVAATTMPIVAARRTGGLVDWCMVPPWESGLRAHGGRALVSADITVRGPVPVSPEITVSSRYYPL